MSSLTPEQVARQQIDAQLTAGEFASIAEDLKK